MARKSRKHLTNPLLASPPPETSTRKFKVAGYVRLSVENNGKNSDSIHSQKAMIIDYINKFSDLELVSMYEDNGATGTNFNRIGFQTMLEDIKSKKINCIIVKDLSRFGRNYIEAGMFLENIFPFWKVRFISILDQYDSFSPVCASDTVSIPIKNMIHESIATDARKKTTAFKKLQRERGDFMGAKPPYGFNLFKAERRMLVPCEITAPFVLKIFQLYVEGYSCYKIKDWLIEQNAPCPSEIAPRKNSKENNWSSDTVKGILANPAYVGIIAQGKAKNRRLLEDMEKDPDMLVLYDVHEAIIPMELFQQVQEKKKKYEQCLRERKKKTSKIIDPPDILKDLVYCGTCGGRKYRNRCVNERKTKTHIYYRSICHPKRDTPSTCNTKNWFEIVEVVEATLRIYLHQIYEMKEKLINLEKKRKEKDLLLENSLKIKEIEQQQKKNKEQQQQAYENLKAESLTKEEFEAEMTVLLKKSNNFTIQLEGLEKLKGMVSVLTLDDWVKQLERFTPDDELTCELTTALIEKVIALPDDTIEIKLKFHDEYELLMKKLTQGEW